MNARLILLLAGFAIVCTAGGCGRGGSGAAAEPSPSVEPLLTHRGRIEPLDKVLGDIRFKPFIPAKQFIATAAIPAFARGQTRDDIPENWGAGFEYMSGRYAYLLSQWPHFGHPMSGTTTFANESGCQIGLYPLKAKPMHEAATWANGRYIWTLQPAGGPEGDAPSAAVRAEARRLVRRGACR